MSTFSYPSIDDFETKDWEARQAKQQQEPRKEKSPSKRQPPQRGSRVAALFLGFSVLGVVIVSCYFGLRDKSLQRKKTSNSSGVIDNSALAAHDAPDDCWLAIYGNVYEMTTYATEHPGGPDYIWDYCGMDATEAYTREHPQSLLKTIPEYLLGTHREQDVQDETEDKDGETTVIVIDNSSKGKEEEDSDAKKEDDKDDKKKDEAETSTTVETSAPVAAPTAGGCADSSVYTLSTVALHNSRDDCYYVLYDTVYDLTDYVDEHPGGARRVFNECGTDATVAYSSERKHDRSLLAKEGMSKYVLGTIGEC